MDREEESMKFVEFDQFCPSCKHWTDNDADEPCNSCLETPARPGTIFPENYEGDKTKEFPKRKEY